MMLVPGLHSIASVAFEQMLYSLAEGSLLVMSVALALRFVPQKSSRTTFVIWFSALLASTFLPLLGLQWGRELGTSTSRHALITIPISIALYASLAWLVVAGAGLARVIAGVWQLRRLREGCQDVRPEQLGPELARIVEEFSHVRSASILASPKLEVPTAVGFLSPAVILPEWMVEEGPSDELKHVVLHELAHLRRYDDWTNLVQKIAGALLFFHPGVWWMQRELSTHREMACDDAVLAQTASPRSYAECLAHVAEKSFLRRQIALAQGAVSRMKELTRRVNRILDPNRRSATQVWKPAIPAVAALAVLSGISGSWAPGLVKVDDGSKSASVSPAPSSPVVSPVAAGDRIPSLRAWPAQMKTGTEDRVQQRSLFVSAKHTSAAAVRSVPAGKVTRPKRDEHTPVILASGTDRVLATNRTTPERHGQYLLVIETRQTVTAGADGWQISVQQLRWLVPVSQIQKPLPNKI